MLFNSIEFLIFLPIVFVLYWFVFNRKLSVQNVLLLAASYFFYAWWSEKFLLLLALSTVIDYFYGFGVASANKRKAKLFLILSVINNLGILAVFKYYNFFIEQFQSAAHLMGFQFSPLILKLALPIGISFYTFHGMSYVFDIYRGKQKPVKSFIDYAVFVSFFPLLVAGPIERANHLLPQVQSVRQFSFEQAASGCRLILWGLFKKVVIADSLAQTADFIFLHPQDLGAFTLILGVLAFSFQIYGDFSGYSDIALGTAKLFGFELLSNFRFPYFSRDIAEFWRRWHISLSSWFRDYLYFPMGGSREGQVKAVRNTFVIFLLSGFWHGASWNFIAWGFLHACAFVPLLLLKRNRVHIHDVVAGDRVLPSLKELFQMLATFAFVSFAWIFFRAEGMDAAVDYIVQIFKGMFQGHTDKVEVPGLNLLPVYILPFVLCDWYLRRNERDPHIKSKWVEVLVSWILILLILYSFNSNSSFIYFQF